MASGGAVRNDASASLLVDEWSPAVVTAAGSCPLRRLLHGGKATWKPATTTTRRYDVKRFICPPFSAVFRSMSCARDAAISTCDGKERPTNNGTALDVGRERRREARRRRPSLEQLLRMEAPPPASARRPDHHRHKLGNGDDGERRRTTIVPVELEAGGPGRQTNAKKLVVIAFASLRACSRAPRINDGKVAARHAPGKAELFYYRPIPMGRRCRVQHLEESPHSASSDLSSLLDLGQTM